MESLLPNGSKFDGNGTRWSKISRGKRWAYHPCIRLWATVVFLCIALIYCASTLHRVNLKLVPFVETSVAGAAGDLKHTSSRSASDVNVAEVAGGRSIKNVNDLLGQLGGIPFQPCHRPDLLSDSQQAAYHESAKRYSNVKIRLVSKSDEAVPLQSQLPPLERAITIVTQVSQDRWPQLEAVASTWGGVLCAAVHAPTHAHIASIYREAKALHERIEKQRYCRLHLQIVVEDGYKDERDAQTASYPVNALRNVALRMAKTDLVFLLDVDFIPAPGLHEALTADEQVYSDLITRTQFSRQLLVVPAFEHGPADKIEPTAADDTSSGTRNYLDLFNSMPLDMGELRQGWLNFSVDAFRASNSWVHGPTAYSYFMHPLTTEPYQVLFRDMYEPYVIAARTIIPHYDERFRGYGRNKMSHLYHCSVLGMSFVVLPNTYVWAIDHPKTDDFHRFKSQTGIFKETCQGTVDMKVLYEIFKKELHTMPYPF